MSARIDLRHDSLAQIPEGALVARLLADQQWRERVIGISGIPSVIEHFLEVPLAGLPGDVEGDIDILLVPPGHPEESIAVQAKRIKVSDPAFLTGKPNKLHEIEKARKQAGVLARIGFSQVYCFVFVVVDSRVHNVGKYTYEGLTPYLKALIDAAISVHGLDERVGLVQFELVQPMDDRPLSSGTYRGQARRLSQCVVQPSELTAWVRDTVGKLRPNYRVERMRDG